MKSLIGQQVGFKLKRKRCVKSAISNHGFQLVSMKKISHLVLYCYVLLTVFIVCLGSIKDIVFIFVSCVRCFVRFFFNILIVLASTRKVEFDQTLAQLIHFVASLIFRRPRSFAEKPITTRVRNEAWKSKQISFPRVFPRSDFWKAKIS